MKIFSLLVAMLIIFSCATKTKTKDVSKSKTNLSIESNSSNESGSNIKVDKQFNGFGMSEFGQAISFMNWGYNGNQGDEFSLSISETENGYQMTAKGSGNANAGKSQVDETSKWENQFESKLDSVVDKFSSENVELRQIVEAQSKAMKIEKESTGFQAGAYIIMAFLLAIFLLLVWLGLMLNKYLKPVRAFLEQNQKLMDSSV